MSLDGSVRNEDVARLLKGGVGGGGGGGGRTFREKVQ